MTVKSVKYLYKYIYKGHDCANIEINERIDHDEIKTFLDARYVSAPEALWRLFEYQMHEQSHSVFRLAIHLPFNQAVYFRPGEEEQALDRAAQQNSHLTAWFNLNQLDENAHQYLYTEIPLHYVFDKSQKKWKVRQRGGSNMISRMFSVKPSAGEKFFLRVLLLHTPGAFSFEHLRTVDGTIYNTFREACSARGLLQDDNEWHNTLAEAAAFSMPRQLRQLFAMLLTHCDPLDPLQLWESHKDALIEDYVRRMNAHQAEQTALGFISDVIKQCGKTLSDYNLPALDEIPPIEEENVLERAEQAALIRQQLNAQQCAVADAVIAAITNVEGGVQQDRRLFFLDGPGGTGKTFTYNYLVDELRSRGLKVATAAWSGVASTLLKGGVTVHNLFRLPVPILETSSCNVSPTSKHATFLREQSLFMLDEASMIPTHAFHAIDRLLRDICGSNLPFGGKVILLGGDFRQVLPVIRHARPAQVIEVCLKSSPLWQLVTKFSLTQNMRVRENEQLFSQWLLEVGNGNIPTDRNSPFENAIPIPECCILPVGSCIVEAVFGMQQQCDFASTVILTPTNDDSLIINGKVLNLLDGECISYFSADDIECDEEEERLQYPIEFLNSITPSGMPQHCLKLKIGAIVMLLRNLNLKKGLCNGTRLVVRHLHRNVIDAEVITGIAAGERVLIPRVQLAPSDTGMPFTLKRRQFPLRLAYSMTINKAQGQTFNKVGLYMQRPCFSHGQLYVAFSRARAFDDIKVQVVPNRQQGMYNNLCYTQNIVYKQLLS
jgi:hypothetical protein